jgi:hypothetical protein
MFNDNVICHTYERMKLEIENEKQNDRKWLMDLAELTLWTHSGKHTFGYVSYYTVKYC